MTAMEQNQTRSYVSTSLPGGGTGTKFEVYDCLVYSEVDFSVFRPIGAINRYTHQCEMGVV